MKPVLDIRFFATDTGAEPVREWLKDLSPIERKTMGEDIKAVQFGWPLGMPLVRSMGAGLWEVRIRLENRIARVLFVLDGSTMVFVACLYQKAAGDSKTRPGYGQGSIEVVKKEMTMHKKNIGSSFDDFLQEEAILDETTAVALKRVISWQIAEEMKAQQLTKTTLAKRMHTSRAALNRLLDENDASLTLTTLASAAAALGKKINLQLSA